MHVNQGQTCSVRSVIWASLAFNLACSAASWVRKSSWLRSRLSLVCCRKSFSFCTLLTFTAISACTHHANQHHDHHATWHHANQRHGHHLIGHHANLTTKLENNNVSSRKYGPKGRCQDARSGSQRYTLGFRAKVDAVLCHTDPALQP